MTIRLLWTSLLFTFALATSAHAATYYVRNGGDDSADGQSPATAWASINKVNAYSFRPGDSVLFHEGDVWNNSQLKVDWSGTSSQQVVVGAYYVEVGKAHPGFRSSRPTLDGNDKFPSSRYAPLVLVVGNRVRVQDLAIVNSEGRGITFDTVSQDQAVNLVLSRIYDGAIKVLDSQNGLIEGNSISDSDRVWSETRGVWASGISALRSSNMVIRNNRVIREFGEGINVFDNTVGSLIENNYIFGARAVGIYADAAPNTTIRYNVVIGIADSKYWRTNDSVGAGIAINNENYHYKGHGGSLSPTVQTTNAKIYGNLVAYTGEGIGIWGQLSSSSFSNTKIYNNTLVDNDIQFVATDVPMPGSQLINNILLSLSPGTRDVVLDSPNGMTAKDNYFSQGDPGHGLSNAGNLFKGLTLERMQGWRTVTDPATISWRDFRVVQGSSTIGAGDSAPMQKATSTDLYNLDFNRKPYNSPPSIGAISAQTGKIPAAPSGLSTRISGASS